MDTNRLCFLNIEARNLKDAPRRTTDPVEAADLQEKLNLAHAAIEKECTRLGIDTNFQPLKPPTNSKEGD
jgi:hypothetical protein